MQSLSEINCLIYYSYYPKSGNTNYWSRHILYNQYTELFTISYNYFDIDASFTSNNFVNTPTVSLDTYEQCYTNKLPNLLDNKHLTLLPRIDSISNDIEIKIEYNPSSNALVYNVEVFNYTEANLFVKSTYYLRKENDSNIYTVDDIWNLSNLYNDSYYYYKTNYISSSKIYANNIISDFNIYIGNTMISDHGNLDHIDTTQLWNGTLSDWTVSCLLKGTKVKVSNGYKNIEDLNEGDYVISHLGNKVKIIKKDSWKIHWTDNIDKSNKVYALKRFGKKTYLSTYHKIMTLKKTMVEAHLSNLPLATKEEI